MQPTTKPPIRDVATGKPIAFDPHAGLSKQPTKEAERDVRMSELAAGLMSGRFAVSREKNTIVAKDSGARMSGDLGDLVKMDLGPSDVNQGYFQFVATPTQLDEYVASEAAPVTLVSRERGFFFAGLDADALSRKGPFLATPDAQLSEMQPRFGSTTYSCTPWGLATVIGREILGAADFDLEAVAVVRLVHALMHQRELLVASLVNTSAKWTAANVGAAALKWNAATSSTSTTAGSTSSLPAGTGTTYTTTAPTPVTDLFGRYASSLLPARTLIVSEQVEQYLRLNAQMQQFLQAGGELPKIVVARAKSYDSTSASALQYIWSCTTAGAQSSTTANAVLVRSPRSESDISTLRTLRWKQVAPLERTSEGVFARSAFLPNRGGGGAQLFSILFSDAVVFLDSTTGGLITGVVA